MRRTYYSHWWNCKYVRVISARPECGHIVLRLIQETQISQYPLLLLPVQLLHGLHQPFHALQVPVNLPPDNLLVLPNIIRPPIHIHRPHPRLLRAPRIIRMRSDRDALLRPPPQQVQGPRVAPRLVKMTFEARPSDGSRSCGAALVFPRATWVDVARIDSPFSPPSPSSFFHFFLLHF